MWSRKKNELEDFFNDIGNIASEIEELKKKEDITKWLERDGPIITFASVYQNKKLVRNTWLLVIATWVLAIITLSILIISLIV